MKTLVIIIAFVLLGGTCYALTPAEEAALKSINPENKPWINRESASVVKGGTVTAVPYSGKATINPQNKPLIYDYSDTVWVDWIPASGPDVIDEILHPKR
jgi:hypothetical protein